MSTSAGQKGEILAWQQQPEPNGTLYYATDLATPDAVAQLFSFCAQSGGYITSDGWSFLFRNYSLQELVGFCGTSGWVGEEGGCLAHLVYQSLLAGYDPISNQKGDYDTETAEFISLDGTVSKVDWKSLEG